MPTVRKRRWKDPKTGKPRTSPWYYLDFLDTSGRKVFKRTDPPVADRRLALEQLHAALSGQMRPKPKDTRLSAVISAYRAHLATHAESTLYAKACWLDWWDKEYGALSADEFDRKKLDEAITKLKAREAKKGSGVSGKMAPIRKGTIGGYVGILRAAVRLALADGLLLSHPMAVIRVDFQSPARRALFTEEEIERLREALPPWGRVLLEVLLHSGLRIGDALRLREGQLRGDMLTVPQEKTGHEMVKPLSAEGVAAIVRAAAFAGAKSGDLLFPGQSGTRPRSYNATAKRFRWAMEQAGIEGRTIHDLRRTFAQRLRRSGADTSTVAALLGQKTTQMAEVYSWVEISQLRAALKKAEGPEKPMNGSIEEATGTEDT